MKTRSKKKSIVRDLIPSGSTLLNLACSDDISGAFGLGKIITLPGGSASGKTLLVLTMFAEMLKEKRFANYKYVYDDGEAALAFDIEYLFGKKLKDKIEPPGGYDDQDDPIHSNTIQDFESHILRLCKEEGSFIYVLDSLDSLSSTQELEKEYKRALINAKSDDHAKDIKGSYKTEKAKILGETLRMINKNIAKTRSSLFIIQQERSNIGVRFGSKKTTSGGKAPFFYSSHQVWLSKTGAIKSKERKIGTTVFAQIKKNKLTGKLRDVKFDIYNDYGLDDIGSCIDFLILEKYWTKNGRKINAFGSSLTKNKLIDQIEEKNLENEVKDMVKLVWMTIEDSIKVNRKRRFK